MRVGGQPAAQRAFNAHGTGGQHHQRQQKTRNRRAAPTRFIQWGWSAWLPLAKEHPGKEQQKQSLKEEEERAGICAAQKRQEEEGGSRGSGGPGKVQPLQQYGPVLTVAVGDEQAGRGHRHAQSRAEEKEDGKRRMRTGKCQGACAHHEQSVPGQDRANAIGPGQDCAQGRTQKLQEEEKAGRVVLEPPFLREHRKQHSQHDRSGAGETKACSQHEARHTPPARNTFQGRATLVRHGSPLLALGLYPACRVPEEGAACSQMRI